VEAEEVLTRETEEVLVLEYMEEEMEQTMGTAVPLLQIGELEVEEEVGVVEAHLEAQVVQDLSLLAFQRLLLLRKMSYT
jgi:hypothetical protein